MMSCSRANVRAPTKRLAWLLAVIACACDGGSRHSEHDAGGDDAGDGELGTVELGSGETAFEPTTDEQHLTLYAGTQGGHHVWLSYHAEGLMPDNVRMTLDVVPMPPARPAHSDVVLDLAPAEGGASGYEFIGWPAQVLDPECAVGSVVSISLTLTDQSGKQASGSMKVIPDPPVLGFTRSCTR
jgi:hypothetical protein